jgi:hypothetical protein
MADKKKFKMDRLEDRITPSYFQPGCDDGSSHKGSSKKSGKSSKKSGKSSKKSHKSSKKSDKSSKKSSKKKGNNGYGNGGRDGSPNGKQDKTR